MIDRLSRAQLRVITHDDQKAIRVLERLLEKVEVLTAVGDMDGILDQLDALEATDAALLTRIVALEAADVTIVSRLDALEAEPPPWDDNEKEYFGDARDAAIYYDGIDLIIDPKEVGSGQLKTNNGKFNVGPNGALYSNVMYAV